MNTRTAPGRFAPSVLDPNGVVFIDCLYRGEDDLLRNGPFAGHSAARWRITGWWIDPETHDSVPVSLVYPTTGGFSKFWRVRNVAERTGHDRF